MFHKDFFPEVVDGRHCMLKSNQDIIATFASYCYPFPKQQILDSSKLKVFADDTFNFDLSGRRFSERKENTVGRGEIARNEQFLLFPQCFQKTFTADT